MNIREEANGIIQIHNKELEGFRKQFNVTATKGFLAIHEGKPIQDVDILYFQAAVEWCEKVLDGQPKSTAYRDVFGVTIEQARTTSTQFHRTKWVQELILFLRPDEQSLYFGERKRIIQAGMAIIDDPRASHRDKTEAMKALQPYIKQEKIDNELNVKVETVGETISESINKQIEELAAKGKMINDSGEIIDVSVIE